MRRRDYLSMSGPNGSSPSTRHPERLIADARNGATEHLGPLLDSYGNYLRLLATTQIDEKLRVKVSPSDLVQETMLGAYRDFGQFRGCTERELLAWLRQILINRLHVFVQRHVLAQKRDLHRELSLDEIGAAVNRSTANLQAAILADHCPSPSNSVIRRENAVLLADHLAKMSPHYREVILLRNLQGLSLDEIALQMSRTKGAVRMLWLRAIKQLRETMESAADAE